MDHEPVSNVLEIAKIGARIQQFKDVLKDYRYDLTSWKPEDDKENSMKEAKLDLIDSLMDDYAELFENILFYGS